GNHGTGSRPQLDLSVEIQALGIRRPPGSSPSMSQPGYMPCDEACRPEAVEVSRHSEACVLACDPLGQVMKDSGRVLPKADHRWSFNLHRVSGNPAREGSRSWARRL